MCFLLVVDWCQNCSNLCKCVIDLWWGKSCIWSCYWQSSALLFTYLNNLSQVWRYLIIINDLMISFYELTCFILALEKKKRSYENNGNDTLMLFHTNFISLKIVTCILQSLVGCVNAIKDKRNSFLPPLSLPGNKILNYMLLVAVSWIQKDAFTVLNSKKYFLQKGFPGQWGEREERSVWPATSTDS